MREPAASMKTVAWVRSGAIAGALSTISFAYIHHLFISDIWWSIVPMAAAGSLCGICLAWSYSRLVDVPTVASWMRYNVLHVLHLVVLGLVSIAIFEPVTTLAAVIDAGPPRELTIQVLPMTAAFAIGASLLIGGIYRAGRGGVAAALLATTVLVALLGLNVSVIGLVSIPYGSLYLIAEMYALVIALAGVYAGLFVGLERGHWGTRHRE